MTQYYVIVDCKPGYPRPDHVIQSVVAELLQDNQPVQSTQPSTRLVVPENALTAFQHVSSCFGEWEFVVDGEKHPWIAAHLTAIGDKLKRFHQEGTIRYASWGSTKDH